VSGADGRPARASFTAGSSRLPLSLTLYAPRLRSYVDGHSARIVSRPRHGRQVCAIPSEDRLVLIISRTLGREYDLAHQWAHIMPWSARLSRPAPRFQQSPRTAVSGGYGLSSCSVAAELNYSLIRGWVPPGRGDPARRDPAGTSVLSGRTSHISCDDVGGMPVQAGPRSVVSHRRAGISVRRSFLDIAQRYTRI
jgi:hypothetical protein